MPQFIRIWNAWRSQSEAVRKTRKVLKPLQKKSFTQTVIIYERGSKAWDDAGELLAASPMDSNRVVRLIDQYHAADELCSHIFFDKVREFQHSEVEGEIRNLEYRGEEDPATVVVGDVIPDYDWSQIHAYCDHLFTEYSAAELLSRAYMFRLLPPTIRRDEFLWTNPVLEEFVRSLPDRYARIKALGTSESKLEPIAWEFFRELVTRYLDPLDESKIRLIETMVDQRRDETTRLKNKCLELAGDLIADTSRDLREQKIKEHIKAKVENDLYELLQIDTDVFRAMIAEIFSDDKLWVALTAFVSSCIYGANRLAAGSATLALGRVGANAVKQWIDKNKRLRASPYSLIYRIRSR
jgi:hypothetical protein